MRPFENKVPLWEQSIQSYLCRPNLVISKQADAILDSCIAAGLMQYPMSLLPSLLVCVPKEPGDTPWSLSPTHVKSKEILTGNVPLRPDYHTPAYSAFATPATPAPPPKAQLLSSLPPSLARVGSTIPLGHPVSSYPTPAPFIPQLGPSVSAAPFTLYAIMPDPDVQAAAALLSDTWLSSSNRDWKHRQRKTSCTTRLTATSYLWPKPEHLAHLASKSLSYVVHSSFMCPPLLYCQ